MRIKGSNVTMGLVMTMAFGITGCVGAKNISEPSEPVLEQAKIETSYQKVVDLPGQKKLKLFEKSKQWMAKTFASSKQVIEYENLQEGKIIGNGAADYIGYYGWSFAMGDIPHECRAKFTMTEDIKDEKIRITFDQIRDQTCDDSSTVGIREISSLGMNNIIQKITTLTQSLIDDLSKNTSENW